MRSALFACILLASLAIHVQCGYLPSLVTIVALDKPGFVTFIPNDLTKSYHLAVSSFHGIPYSSDYVYYIANFSLINTNQVVRLDKTNLYWPNEISLSAISLLGPNEDPYGGLFVPGGFLVPTKTNGALYYYPFTSADRSKISSKPPVLLTKQVKQSWFYHRARVVDLNGDGTNDILTCRAVKPIFGDTKVEMVALVYDQASKSYKETVLLENVCDVFFDVADIDNDGRLEIIAAGFFVPQLSIIYSNDQNNSFLNGNINVTKIDTNGGAMFDIEIIDLDLAQDKNKELLVTNHQGNDQSVKGSVFYYKLNGDVRTGTWTRGVIYDNFPVLKSGQNQAAPGGAKAFWPKTSEAQTTRPYLLVAGDGAEKAYVFEPSQTGEIAYSLTWSYLYQGYTVGGTSVADVDNDGYAEIIVPAYESNKAYVYTFAPNIYGN